MAVRSAPQHLLRDRLAEGANAAGGPRRRDSEFECFLNEPLNVLHKQG